MFRRAALASLAFVLGCPGGEDAPDAAVLADAPSMALDAASDETGPSPDATALDAPSTDDAGPRRGVVHVVLFTHIEDSTPPGSLSSPMARTRYVRLRTQLLAMAELMERHGLRWVLQPDDEYLGAALLDEDAATTMDTGGMNLFVYLCGVRGVVVDPHSHENGGDNYTHVAHLLERLGVGGSTVIGATSGTPRSRNSRSGIASARRYHAGWARRDRGRRARVDRGAARRGLDRRHRLHHARRDLRAAFAAASPSSSLEALRGASSLYGARPTLYMPSR